MDRIHFHFFMLYVLKQYVNFGVDIVRAPLADKTFL